MLSALEYAVEEPIQADFFITVNQSATHGLVP